jgi:hypothetical protein
VAVPARGADVTLVVRALGEVPAVVERGARFIGPADERGTSQ